MKAAFFDPYLDTLGGGEKYTLTFAEYLLSEGWEVDLFWNDPKVLEKLKSRFSLNIERINFILRDNNLFERWQKTKRYDLFFWLSDGSIPWMFAGKNILHFQVPFHDVNGGSLLNKFKLKKVDVIVCNSAFTKKFIDGEFGVSSTVIYPPVDLNHFLPGKKENIILSVGRFSQLLQAKRQDVLVEVFQDMVDKGLKGWKLVLVGGADVGATQYLMTLEKQAKHYPIEILPGLEFEKVEQLYAQTKIFWNASGFAIDEDKNPEKVEHFGMVVVEAMAAGCVPLVVGKGGLKEIIKNKINGFFWEEKEDLSEITLDLINNPESLRKISREVIKSSQDFSKEKFCREFKGIIGDHV